MSWLFMYNKIYVLIIQTCYINSKIFCLLSFKKEDTMATVRINIGKVDDEVTEKPWDKMTLMEKWKHQYGNRKKAARKSANSSKKYAQIMYAFQCTTQLYVFLWYIVPRLFIDYDEWTQYWLKVLVVFICIEWLMNYFCTICYSTDIPITRDNPTMEMKEKWENPPEFFESRHPIHTLSNGHAPQIINYPRDDGGIPWRYCESCEIYIPPRAHHCDICQKCILKRDHHCYLVGTCIGFRNQRYFYILSFYTVWIGFVALYFTVKYLQTFYWPNASSWTNILPPVAIYRWLRGAEDLSFHIVLLIIHLYVESLAGLLGIIYCSAQTTLVTWGITMFEFSKQAKVKNSNSINANFRSVFGDFWALNFLFPMPILFKQREDGYKWIGIKIDHNSNYQKKSNQ